MDKLKCAKEFCVGCGLCKSYFGEEKVSIKLNQNGFYSPSFNLSAKEIKRLSEFCPVLRSPEYYDNNVWGRHIKSFLGFSIDEEIRHKASSGGILTSMSKYLLDKKIVDKIIQIGNDSECLLPHTVVVDSVNQLISNCGSRYVAVSLLENLLNILNSNKELKFALIGKPCDIRAVYNLKKLNPDAFFNLKCTFSFFCAGTPSYNATKTLIEKLGFKVENVKKMVYRGNGWPGYATAYDKYGNWNSMGYDDSWGKILGRDIYKGCKFCFDGVGEYADISAGDAWYLDSKGNVSFEEAKGRNVVFARTKLGEQLLTNALEKKYIVLENFELSELSKMQPFQYEKKGVLLPKILAMKTFFRAVPAIDLYQIKKYGYVSNRKVRNYLGTIKRILKNKI